MPYDINKRLNQIRSELVNDTQLTVERLMELQKETRELINKKAVQLLKNKKYFRKISIPKSHIKLWKFKSKQIKIPINWRYVLSIPFIYGMFFPAVIFHLCIEIYHQVCFRLYRIPLVNYREYFIYDRQLLSLLNPWEKINCIYCSYVNNLIRYSSEIGGRTERYWCPIKYYRRITNPHSQYDKFIKGTDPKKMREQWEELRDFSDLEFKAKS